MVAKPVRAEASTVWGIAQEQVGSNASASVIMSVAKSLARQLSVSVPEWGISGKYNARQLSRSFFETITGARTARAQTPVVTLTATDQNSNILTSGVTLTTADTINFNYSAVWDGTDLLASLSCSRTILSGGFAFPLPACATVNSEAPGATNLSDSESYNLASATPGTCVLFTSTATDVSSAQDSAQFNFCVDAAAPIITNQSVAFPATPTPMPPPTVTGTGTAGDPLIYDYGTVTFSDPNITISGTVNNLNSSFIYDFSITQNGGSPLSPASNPNINGVTSYSFSQPATLVPGQNTFVEIIQCATAPQFGCTGFFEVHKLFNYEPAIIPDPLCGTTLTSDFTFKDNIDCSAFNGTALMVGSAGITIDLNSFTLSVHPEHTGIEVGTGFDNVGVRNGRINGGQRSINISGNTGFSARNIIANASGLIPAGQQARLALTNTKMATIIESTLDGNGSGSGLYFIGGHSDVTVDHVSARNFDHGFRAERGSVGFDNLSITKSAFMDNAVNGANLDNAHVNVTVTDNDFRGNGNAGFILENFTTADSKLELFGNNYMDNPYGLQLSTVTGITVDGVLKPFGQFGQNSVAQIFIGDANNFSISNYTLAGGGTSGNGLYFIGGNKDISVANTSASGFTDHGLNFVRGSASVENLIIEKSKFNNNVFGANVFNGSGKISITGSSFEADKNGGNGFGLSLENIDSANATLNISGNSFKGSFIGLALSGLKGFTFDPTMASFAGNSFGANEYVALQLANVENVALRNLRLTGDGTSTAIGVQLLYGRGVTLDKNEFSKFPSAGFDMTRGISNICEDCFFTGNNSHDNGFGFVITHNNNLTFIENSAANNSVFNFHFAEGAWNGKPNIAKNTAKGTGIGNVGVVVDDQIGTGIFLGMFEFGGVYPNIAMLIRFTTGFTIDGIALDNMTQVGSGITSQGNKDLTINGVKITGFEVGVNSPGGPGLGDERPIIQKSTLDKNKTGLYLAEARDLAVSNSSFTGNGTALLLTAVQQARVINNNIDGNDDGVIIKDSSDVSITGNTANSNRRRGVSVDPTSFITMMDNTISLNSTGLELSQVTDHKIYHNDIFKNTEFNVSGGEAYELWNHDTNQGNYWGHECPAAFTAGVDSNRLDIRDDFAYGVQTGWTKGASPCNAFKSKLRVSVEEVVAGSQRMDTALETKVFPLVNGMVNGIQAQPQNYAAIYKTLAENTQTETFSPNDGANKPRNLQSDLVTLGANPGNNLVLVRSQQNKDGSFGYMGFEVQNLLAGQSRDVGFNITPNNTTTFVETSYFTQNSGGIWQSSRRAEVIKGSELQVFQPDDIIWTNGTEIYPFLFISDSDWTVDVCLSVPVGYTVVAPGTCGQTLVANQAKVFEFKVADIGSPKVFDATAKMTFKHKGKSQSRSFKVHSHNKNAKGNR